MNCRIEFNTIFYQFHEIPLNQNLIDFLFVPEKYFGSWVFISVNANFISFFRSSGENVWCRIEFMMILGNSLESKCDHQLKIRQKGNFSGSFHVFFCIFLKNHIFLNTNLITSPWMKFQAKKHQMCTKDKKIFVDLFLSLLPFQNITKIHIFPHFHSCNDRLRIRFAIYEVVLHSTHE